MAQRGTRLADYTFHERAAERRIVQPSNSTRRRDGALMPAVKDRAARRLSVALSALALGGVRAPLPALRRQATLPTELETVLQDEARGGRLISARVRSEVDKATRAAPTAVKAKRSALRRIT